MKAISEELYLKCFELKSAFKLKVTNYFGGVYLDIEALYCLFKNLSLLYSHIGYVDR